MILQGIVQDGKGDASYWIKKYSDAYLLWTGVQVYPGSLNLRVPYKLDWDDKELIRFKKVYSLAEFGGNRDVCIAPCSILNASGKRVTGFVWSTTNAANDANYKVLEVISAARLRDNLQLQNGDRVTVALCGPSTG